MRQAGEVQEDAVEVPRPLLEGLSERLFAGRIENAPDIQRDGPRCGLSGLDAAGPLPGGHGIHRELRGCEGMCLGEALARQVDAVGVAGQRVKGEAHEGILRHLVEEGKLACPPHERLGVSRVGVRQGLDRMQGLAHGPDKRRLVDHLGCGLAQDVRSRDASPAVAEKLGHPRPRAVDERAAHRLVGKAVGAQAAAVLLPRLRLRQAHPGQRRLGEDDADVVAVIDAALDGQAGVGGRHDPVGLGRRGEQVGPGDVAAGVNVAGRSAQPAVRDDAPGVEHDARLLEGEPLEVGPPPHGDEHPLGLDHLPRASLPLDREGNAALPVGKPRGSRSGKQADPVCAKNLEQAVDQLSVGRRQEARGHLDDGRLHAQPAEGGGVLQAVHAAAQDDERPRQCLQPVEGFVGESFDGGKPRDVGDEGNRACGDDEFLRREGLPARVDPMRVQETRFGGDHADPDFLEGLRQILLVGRPDDVPDAGHDPRALQADAGQPQQAEALEVRHLAACVSQPDQGLARDAGGVRAASADPRFLDDGHALAQAHGRHGGDHPGDAGADDDQVVVALPFHGYPGMGIIHDRARECKRKGPALRGPTLSVAVHAGPGSLFHFTFTT